MAATDCEVKSHCNRINLKAATIFRSPPGILAGDVWILVAVLRNSEGVRPA